ncbi:conserved phage C-terminal domain-containing protein [Listeria sp. SHR_NRA_18]|uniref:conserved phage C-terminal domain-containing protein n=1 Tax=Listeria sp. SHR_NRA_18 TaxID=2269046 RepID=UPI001374FB67|nr:conserved phage C-terminal domain-containing protein [Listeria sp. SHR_NRA_18]
MAKKYYWLKLKNDFFNNTEIKVLRRVAGGDTYTLIYLEMLLLSLENNGFLYFEGVGEDLADELSVILGEKKEDVQFLLTFLEAKKLIEVNQESDTIYLNTIEGMIGKESGSARRMRDLRAKEEQPKLPEASHCDNDVQKSDKKVTLELRDKSLEKEKEKRYIAEQKLDDLSEAVSAIVAYLNEKANKNYKTSTKVTRTKIKSRLGEGFTIDDFKKVIDIKTVEWLNDPKMQNFLRPETLFGNKFESYLNQPMPTKGGYGNAQNNGRNARGDEDKYKAGFFGGGAPNA